MGEERSRQILGEALGFKGGRNDSMAALPRRVMLWTNAGSLRLQCTVPLRARQSVLIGVILSHFFSATCVSSAR
jgi:hypothetical protein